MTDVYEGSDRPVDAVCGKGYLCLPRVGPIRYLLKQGVPVMGCISCSVV